uniref:Uncharacterized protein n=1 Tax=Desulfovibrio sp. U5L TaxID=596152 RepID=I2Q062_9BACT
MTILRTNKPDLPTGADYLHAVLCLLVLAALCGAGWLMADARGFHVSAEHEAIMHGARLLAGGMGR